LFAPDILRIVRLQLLADRFFRSDCYGRLELEWMDATKKVIRVRDLFRYRVQNRGRETENYEIRLFQEITQLSDGNSGRVRFKELRYRLQKRQEVVMDENAIIEQTRDKSTQAASFRVLDVPVASGVFLEVTTVIESERDAFGSDNYILTHAASGLRLEINHPDDLEVKATSLHSGEATEKTSAGHVLIHLCDGLLAFQGVLVQWFRKP
jgi:hypothetical protein